MMKLFRVALLLLSPILGQAADQWTVAPAEFYDVGQPTKFRVEQISSLQMRYAGSGITARLMKPLHRPWSEGTPPYGFTNPWIAGPNAVTEPTSPTYANPPTGVSIVDANIAGGGYYYWTVASAPAGVTEFSAAMDVVSKRRRFKTELIHMSLADLVELPPELKQRTAELRDVVPGQIRTVADQIKGESQDLVDVLDRISKWVTSYLTYTSQATKRPSDLTTILNTKTANCVGYSGLYAAIANAVGIPARVAAGAMLSDESETRQTDHHMWVEVFIPHVGWVELEPQSKDNALSIPETYVQSRDISSSTLSWTGSLVSWSAKARGRVITAPPTAATPTVTVVSPRIQKAKINEPTLFVAKITPPPGDMLAAVLFYEQTPSGAWRPFATKGEAPHAVTWTPKETGTYLIACYAYNSQWKDSFSYVAVNVTQNGPEAPTKPFLFLADNVAVAPNLPFFLELLSEGAPGTYSVEGLPPGLSLDPTQGEIYGRYNSDANATIKVTYTNSYGTATQSVRLVVDPEAPLPRSLDLLARTSGTSVSFSAAADGATSYSATGLPAGLQIDSSSGLITGKPAAAGKGTFYVTALNAKGSAQFAVSYDFAAAPAPLVVSVKGSGTVTEGFLGTTSRMIGETLTITATPAADWTFSGWTGSISSPDSTLTFGMSEGLTLTANFASLLTPLSVTKTGGGTISEGFAGTTTRRIGDTLTITATPITGYVFTGWTGSVTATDPTLTFTMSVGFAVKANFAPVPFMATMKWMGILERGANNTGEPGRITLSNVKGKTSIKLTHGRTTFTGKGLFDASGRATVKVKFKKLIREVTVQYDASSKAFVGTVADPASTSSQSFLTHLFVKPASAYVGTYTATLTGETSTGVETYGYLHAVVAKSGTVAYSGYLPDGTRMTGSTLLTEGNGFAYYASTKSGAAAGRIVLEGPAPTVAGSLIWNRLSGAKGHLYQPIIDVSGARYVAVKKKKDALPAVSYFSWGGIEGIAGGSVASHNDVRILAPTSKLVFNLNKKKGIASGTFLDNTKVRRKFVAVVRKENDLAVGIFWVGQTVGFVRFDVPALAQD